MGGYSDKAQPYLDAIAEGIFTSAAVRNWLIKGTVAAKQFTDADVLIDEPRVARWKYKKTKQPFWANQFCGRDARCTCRIPGSAALESDAIFYLRNHQGHILAIHLEFKHPKEPFQFGQPEAYPLRAECFLQTWADRSAIIEHHCWTTILICAEDTLSDSRISHFQRVITHAEVAEMIAAYPNY